MCFYMFQSNELEDDDMNGSDMESDIGSDNDDINDIDSEKLDASHREILEKLKRQELEEREEIERELQEAQREAVIRAQRHEELRAQELRALEDKNRPGRGIENIMAPLQTEIKMQRPLGLLAQHGLSTKSHPLDREREREREDHEKDSNPIDTCRLSPIEKDRIKDLEKFDRDRPIPLTMPLPRPDIDFSHPAFMDTRGFGIGPPSHPESPRSTETPGLDGSGSTGAQTPAGHHWTFEEQFKQVSLGHISMHVFFHIKYQFNLKITTICIAAALEYPLSVIVNRPPKSSNSLFFNGLRNSSMKVTSGHKD